MGCIVGRRWRAESRIGDVVEGRRRMASESLHFLPSCLAGHSGDEVR